MVNFCANKSFRDPGFDLESQKTEDGLEQWIELYVTQQNLSPRQLFDLEDRIYRNAASNREKIAPFLDRLKGTPIYEKLELYLQKGSRFEVGAKNVPVEQGKRPNKILRACLENTRNKVGGVGFVLTGLREAQQKLGAEKSYSVHPLYSKDKSDARDFRFQGTIDHQYEGKSVRSTVYKDRINDEYVIQPDPTCDKIFDLLGENAPYSSTPNSSFEDRVFYFGSAVAAFVDQYVGKTKDKHIDIVQCESGAFPGCALPLVRQNNQIRMRLGKPINKSIYVVHGPLQENICVPTERLKKIGIDISSYKEKWVDLIGEGMRYGDKALFVSPQIASEALSEDLSVSLGRNELIQKEKVTSICNGVKTEQFDVTNERVFGSLGLKRTFDANGNETTDYTAYRAHLKGLLHQAGLIADPSLPLVLYLGRYSHEKGIDVLVDVIQNFDRSKAQFVTVGINMGQDHLVQQLQQMTQTTHKDRLRLLTTYAEQNSPFKVGDTTYPITVGQMLRAAADVFFMPSHKEACGLVSMECQCSGALLVAPYIQGFKSICRPDGLKNGKGTCYSLKRDANSICYNDSRNKKEAHTALEKGVDALAKMSKEEKNSLAARIRNYAIPNYSWYHQDSQTKTITGAVVSYHNLYNEINPNPNKSPSENECRLIAPEQMPIIPVPKSKLAAFYGVIHKISTWFKHFFLSISSFFKGIFNKIGSFRARANDPTRR